MCDTGIQGFSFLRWAVAGSTGTDMRGCIYTLYAVHAYRGESGGAPSGPAAPTLRVAAVSIIWHVRQLSFFSVPDPARGPAGGQFQVLQSSTRIDRTRACV